jgi:hypothetical protein
MWGPPPRAPRTPETTSATREEHRHGEGFQEHRRDRRRGLPRGGAIVKRLSRLSEPDLSRVDSYERKHQNRKTIHDKIASLRD